MRSEGLNRLTSFDLNKNSRDFIVMKFLIDDLKYVIEKYASGRLLDVGCGNKPYESLFKGKVSIYTGCDVVQSSLKKVDVICDATELKFELENFDTVFTTQVIEHVNDPEKMLKEINRVLLPGGTLILSAPFCWELHEEPYDFYRYSKYGLKAMLERNQFTVLDIRANGGKWAALFQLFLNITYSTFQKRIFFSKINKFIFIHCHLTQLINLFAIWLDRKFNDELLTLNYVVVARKK